MKKFLTILFTLWICSMCTICAFAWKGANFNSDAVINTGQPPTAEIEDYTYVGYAVVNYGSGSLDPPSSGRHTRIENLYLQSSDPMTISFRYGTSGGLSITVPHGTYYRNYYIYRGTYDGVYTDGSTPVSQNSRSYTVNSQSAFYPAVPMINADTGEIIQPDTAPVFELNCFPDSKGNINCSLVCVSGEGSYNASIYITPTSSYTDFSSGSYTTIDTVNGYTPLDEASDGFKEVFAENFEQLYWYHTLPWSILLDPAVEDEDREDNVNFDDVGLYPFKNSINSVRVGQMLRRSLSDTVPEQPLPSPRSLINAGSVSIAKPLGGVLNVPAFRGNASQGGVYAEDDCIIFAAVQVDGQYMLYAYQVDLSAITDQRYNWLPSGTIQTDLPAGGVTDLQSLAEFLRDVNYNNNVNNTTIYNNYMSDMEQNAPQYILGGLRLWLPELSNEFSNLANNFGTSNFTLSDDDLGTIYGWHDDLDDRIERKFAWREVITDEVSFIYTSVLDSGSSAPVFEITLNRWGVTEPMQIVDFSEVDESTHSKIKSFITAFMTISLCVYIFRSLPSTIGNEPE